MDKQQPIFTRKVITTGNSLCITLPKELMNFIEVEHGDDVLLIAQTGKKGKYISFWKKNET